MAITFAPTPPRPKPEIRTMRDVMSFTERLEAALDKRPSIAVLVPHLDRLHQVEDAIERRVDTYRADNEDWETYRGVPSRERPTDLNEDPVPMDDVYSSVVPAREAIATLTSLIHVAQASPRSKALRSPMLVQDAQDAVALLKDSAHWI